ncbi:MAG: hypothetical protein ACREM3_11885 [Candidatus Rokuibacteriota bacterium]
MSTTTTGTLTLGNVLLSGMTKFSERLGTGMDAGAESREIKEALANAAPGLPIGTVLDGVSRAVQELLDVPVSDILVGGWERARDVRAAIQKTRDSDDATELVPLLGHTITSEHRPYVEIVKDEVAIARLVFPLKLELRLEGVVLRVRRGRIGEILAGTVKIKATMKFGDFVVFEKALAPISIPGSLAVARAA